MEISARGLTGTNQNCSHNCLLLRPKGLQGQGPTACAAGTGTGTHTDGLQETHKPSDCHNMQGLTWQPTCVPPSNTQPCSDDPYAPEKPVDTAHIATLCLSLPCCLGLCHSHTHTHTLPHSIQSLGVSTSRAGGSPDSHLRVHPQP